MTLFEWILFLIVAGLVAGVVVAGALGALLWFGLLYLAVGAVVAAVIGGVLLARKAVSS